MKTRLFYAIAADQSLARRFLSDLQVLLKSSRKLRKVCQRALPGLEEVMTSDLARKLAERIAKKERFGIVQVVSVLQALGFLMEQLAKDEYSQDAATDMAADLQECGRSFRVSFSEKGRRIFRETVDTIRKAFLPAYEQLKRRKATVAGVLPVLKSFGTTAELRAVVGTQFRIGMSADKYDPDVKGVVPVISVNIGVDSGIPDEFSFQASPEELEALIEELRCALVCVRHLKAYTSSSAPLAAPNVNSRKGSRR